MGEFGGAASLNSPTSVRAVIATMSLSTLSFLNELSRTHSIIDIESRIVWGWLWAIFSNTLETHSSSLFSMSASSEQVIRTDFAKVIRTFTYSQADMAVADMAQPYGRDQYVNGNRLICNNVVGSVA